MQNEKAFQPARVYLLIRNTLILNRSSIVTVSAALSVLLFLISLVDAYGNTNLLFHRNLYLAVFFPSGILLTSRIFKGLHNPITGTQWLLLPASILEKTLSRILITTVVYMAGSLIVYFVFSIVSEGINRAVVSRSHDLFNPFDPVVLKSMLTYLTVQSPFLAGAVYFQKHTLSKTILSLFCFLFILGIGTGSAAWIIFGEQLPGFDFQSLFYSIEDNDFTLFSRRLLLAIKGFLWFGVPMVSWTICYFRLKETEL